MVLDGLRTARPVKLRSNDDFDFDFIYAYIYMHI